MLWAAWSTTWRREKTPQESRPARVCATLLCGTGGITGESHFNVALEDMVPGLEATIEAGLAAANLSGAFENVRRRGCGEITPNG